MIQDDTEPTTPKKYLQGATPSIISQRKIPKRHPCQSQAIKAKQSFPCELQELWGPSTLFLKTPPSLEAPFEKVVPSFSLDRGPTWGRTPKSKSVKWTIPITNRIFTHEYNLAKAWQNPRQDVHHKMTIFHSCRNRTKGACAQNGNLRCNARYTKGRLLGRNYSSTLHS